MTYEPFPDFQDFPVAFDSTVVQGCAERLKRVRETVTVEAQDRALRVATRQAAVDTGAIEGLYTTDRGFTRTIATQSEFWERALDARGEQVRRSIEDALAAYDYVLDAVTRSVPITAKWIREVHARITAHQETYTVVVQHGDRESAEERPLPHGEYKVLPNNPVNVSTGRLHHYASPVDTPAEMSRFVDQLTSPEFLAAHPVVQAAYAHYAYVCVHPFADGNGRVARALASVFLYRDPGVPLVVFADQRDSYLDTLEAADAGNPVPLVNFFRDRVVDTIGLVIQSMQIPDESSAVSAINQAWGDGLDEGARLAAERLLEAGLDCLKGEVASRQLPSRVSMYAQFSAASPYPCLPDGYTYPDLRSGAVVLISRVSGQSVSLRCVCGLGTCLDLRHPAFVLSADDGSPPLYVRREEIDPSLESQLEEKLKIWAKSVVAHNLVALAASIE